MGTWILIFALAAAPMLAEAQDWSPAQQEIIDVIARCNDGWSQSLAAKEFQIFATVCPESPATVFWYTGRDTPIKYSGETGLWRLAAASGAVYSWSRLVPKTVDVNGDLALIYFDVTWVVEPPTGEKRTNPSRRLTVLRRTDGHWTLVGGAITAVP